ncbi:hypothetical protein [Agrobacterium tumefaciens]
MNIIDYISITYGDENRMSGKSICRHQHGSRGQNNGQSTCVDRPFD